MKKIVSHTYETLGQIDLDIFGNPDERIAVVEKLEETSLVVVDTRNYPEIQKSVISVKIVGDTPLAKLKFQLELEKIEKEV